VVVLGLPHGGAPVAAEVARVLDAPLDVIVVRKLGVPIAAAGDGRGRRARVSLFAATVIMEEVNRSGGHSAACAAGAGIHSGRSCRSPTRPGTAREEGARCRSRPVEPVSGYRGFLPTP
jgi:hypothetical protein